MASVERITGTPVIEYFTTTNATVDFKAGDIVQITSGAGTLIIGTTQHNFGIAMTDAPGNTTTTVPVDVITNDGSLYSMHNGGSSAVTDLGRVFTITYTKGSHTFATAGGADFVVLGLIDAAGTSGGREAGVFKNTTTLGTVGI